MKSIRMDLNIYLDNADIRLFIRIIYRDFGDAFHPILDRVCYMGNDLSNI